MVGNGVGLVVLNAIQDMINKNAEEPVRGVLSLNAPRSVGCLSIFSFFDFDPFILLT